MTATRLNRFSAPHPFTPQIALVLFWSLVWLLGVAGSAHASSVTLTPRDQATIVLERLVADDPRSAIGKAGAWEAEATRTKDRALQLKAMRLRVMALVQLEEGKDLETAARKGLALARETKDAEAEAEFLVGIGTHFSHEGHFQKALAEHDRAFSVAEKAGLTRTGLLVQLAKAFDLGLMDRDAEAQALLYKTHQQFEALGDVYGVRAALLAIGVAYIYPKASKDQLRKAIDFLTRAVAPGTKPHGRHEMANITFNLGTIYQRLGELPKAKADLEKSMSIFRELGDANGEAFCHYRLGLVLAEEKNWRDALKYLDQALPAITQSGDLVMQFNVETARARALAESDRKREAIDALQRAETIRGKSDPHTLDTAFDSAAAKVYARVGDFEKAYRHQSKLYEAEKKNAANARDKGEREARAKFEAKEKETENELLRVRERENSARMVALALAVVLLLCALGGLGLYLWRQGKRSRRFATLALSDELTGLPNRRSILEFARQQIETAQQSGHALSLALIDIDYFKSINDECGHAVGDLVLTAFAKICTAQLRREDRMGRYGGEEFLLVMPSSNLDQAPRVFERLREAAQDVRVGGLNDGRKLSFSMGVTALLGADDNLEKMTKRADDALYRAKQGGRDRYELG